MATMPDAYPLMCRCSRRSRLQLALAWTGSAKKALGRNDDDDEQQAPDGHLHGVAAEELDRKGFGQPDDQATQDGAPDRAQTPDDHGRDGFRTDVVAHEGRDVAIVDGEQRTGEPAEQARDEK